MPIAERITIHTDCLVAMITLDNSTLDFPATEETPSVCKRCRPHYEKARQGSRQLTERALAFVEENASRFWNKDRRIT